MLAVGYQRQIVPLTRFDLLPSGGFADMPHSHIIIDYLIPNVALSLEQQQQQVTMVLVLTIRNKPFQHIIHEHKHKSVFLLIFVVFVRPTVIILSS